MARLLTQNADLKPHGIWCWTLPAWVVRLDGRAINVCPQAGACIKLCYARNGTYNFPAVRAAHKRNLESTLADLDLWTDTMLTELCAKRFRPTGIPRLRDMPRDHLDAAVTRLLDAGSVAIRVHDGGDYYSDDYLLAWLEIARSMPHILFYSYTKEVSRFKRLALDTPRNFLWVYSLGGREDHLVDLEVDRHADVFPTAEAITAAGYYDQTPCDLLSVVAPSLRIGMPANRIPAFRRRANGRRYSEIEAGLLRHSRTRPSTPPQQRASGRTGPLARPQSIPVSGQLSLFTRSAVGPRAGLTSVLAPAAELSPPPRKALDETE